jgi:hypothetical protein
MPRFAVVALFLGLGGFILNAPPARAAALEVEEEWPEITAADKNLINVEQDPEARAVVLRMERDGTISKYGNTMNYHIRMKILTEDGEKYGEVRIPSSKGSAVSSIRARTVKADGAILPVEEEQIFKKVVFQMGDAELVEWVFHFPAVEPGVILEYQYQRHDRFVLYVRPWYFEGPEFTIRFKVTQTILGGMGYAILCDLCPAEIEPTVTQSEKSRSRVYSMELENLPGYREEILMPPRREASPRMEMVLHTWRGHQLWAVGKMDEIFTDWTSIASFVGYNYEQAMKEGRSNIKKLVRGWVEGIEDPQEQLKAVLQHIREDFRYIPYNSVLGASRSVKSLVKNKNADNEEKAVLLMAALRAIGIESQAAIVSGRHVGSVNPRFFSLTQFTHTVVGLPNPDGTYQWLDPTVTCAPFDFIPWKDSGASALLVQSKGGELIELPARSEVSATRYLVTVKPRLDGKAGLEIDAEFLGEDAIALREELFPMGEDGRRAFLQGWLERKRTGSTLLSHVIEELGDFEVPLKIKMKAEAPGLVTVAGDILAVRGCVLSCIDVSPISRAKRTQPLYVARGWNEEETVVIEAPEGMTATEKPSPLLAMSPVARLDFSCTSQGEKTVRCSRQFVAQKKQLPAGEFVKVRRMYDRIVQADQTQIAFNRQ